MARPMVEGTIGGRGGSNHPIGEALEILATKCGTEVCKIVGQAFAQTQAVAIDVSRHSMTGTVDERGRCSTGLHGSNQRLLLFT